MVDVFLKEDFLNKNYCLWFLFIKYNDKMKSENNQKLIITMDIYNFQKRLGESVRGEEYE